MIVDYSGENVCSDEKLFDPNVVAHIQNIYGKPLLGPEVIGVHAMPHAALIHMLKFGHIPRATRGSELGHRILGDLFFFPTGSGRDVLISFFDHDIPLEWLNKNPVALASGYGFIDAGKHKVMGILGLDIGDFDYDTLESLENTVLDSTPESLETEDADALAYFAELLRVPIAELKTAIISAQYAEVYVIGLHASVLEAYQFYYGDGIVYDDDVVRRQYASDLYVRPGRSGIHFSHVAATSPATYPNWPGRNPDYPFTESLVRAGMFLDYLSELDV